MSLEPILREAIADIPSIEEEYATFTVLEYDTLLEEISGTGVALKEDPIDEGLTKLNGIIAQIDAQKTRVSAIVGRAIRNENEFEILYKRMQSIYKREYDSRLPKSPVADYPNAPSREAACNRILQNVKKLMESIEGSYSQAKTFTKIAAVHLAKLDSTNKNISRQITVLQLANEIGEIGRPEKTGTRGTVAQAGPANYTFDRPGLSSGDQ